MTPVEIIALIIVLLGLTKFVMLMAKPQAWLGGGKKLLANGQVFTAVSFVLMLVALRYLLTELTIVQIFAVFGFVMPFMWLAFAGNKEELMAMAEKRVGQGNVFKKNWLISLIWLALMVWVLVEIF